LLRYGLLRRIAPRNDMDGGYCFPALGAAFANSTAIAEISGFMK
jgi:hypothetical protein